MGGVRRTVSLLGAAQRWLPTMALAAGVAGCGGGRLACDEGEVYRDGDCEPLEVSDPVDRGDAWAPGVGTTWQWQLTGAIDTGLDVVMYDVDLFEVSEAELEALGDRVVICYFSAGSLETWRDDIGGVDDEAIGRTLKGWSDEHWLDVTHPTVKDLARSRMDLAVSRGCDGVEPDNVDAYANASGFPLTAAEQLAFNRFLADEAHRRGLSVGLKNDVDQVDALQAWFDWALNEECAAYEECGRVAPIIEAGKAVFHVEYVDKWSDAEQLAGEVCGVQQGFSTLIKTWDLGPEFLACE